MKFINWIKGFLQKRDPEKEKKIAEKVKELMELEDTNNPPKIALIGKTGVGKSSTINALFGTDLPVGHFKSCTQECEEVKVLGKKGGLVLIDMPGLGEDIFTDEKHKKTYFEVLPKCDVILWIMVANGVGKAMSYDQLMLKDVVSKTGTLDRLVVGLNQADLIQPKDEWGLEGSNFPSVEQRENLKYRVDDAYEKIKMVVPNFSRDRITYYSAEKHFNLGALFLNIMKACPEDREWLLEKRKSLADYRDFMSPEFLERLKRKDKS